MWFLGLSAATSLKVSLHLCTCRPFITTFYFCFSFALIKTDCPLHSSPLQITPICHPHPLNFHTDLRKVVSSHTEVLALPLADQLSSPRKESNCLCAHLSFLPCPWADFKKNLHDENPCQIFSTVILKTLQTNCILSY